MDNDPSTHSDATTTSDDEGPNAYELQRAERIRSNRVKMMELGLLDASAALHAARSNSLTATGWKPKASRNPNQKKKRKFERPTGSLRASRRLQGEQAPDVDLSVDIAKAEVGEDAAANDNTNNNPLGFTSKGTCRKQLQNLSDNNITISAPFTILSIGVTVHELGEVYRGPWAERFWSNTGCLFHHAYPVGYRATKEAFNRQYEMRIEAGETGPIFKVVDMSNGVVFQGASPTKPWTEVCKYNRTGQRISGPLYFGFSDPFTQRAIASNLYTPEELEAALTGDKPKPKTLTPEEVAAQSFSQQLVGVGPAMAIVLARTTTLGGVKHSGPDALAQWVQQHASHAAQLTEFLLQSEEVPEATKRWPAWSFRLVPKIVAALQCMGADGGGVDGGNNTAGDVKEIGEGAAQQEQQQHVEGEKQSVAAGSGKEKENVFADNPTEAN